MSRAPRSSTPFPSPTLSRPRPSTAPFQRLAAQALWVTKPAPGAGWPTGPGRYWMTSGDAASPDVLVAQPMGRTGQPVVQIATVPASAARDAVDGEAGVLMTDDPAALESARTLPGSVDVPLEWNRTYVLLAPGRDKAMVGDLNLESLREAVHGDARPAEWTGPGRFWFTDLQSCGVAAGRDTLGTAGRRRRIVYNQSDRSAADLAARLVGLGALGRGAGAAGGPASALESSLPGAAPAPPERWGRTGPKTPGGASGGGAAPAKPTPPASMPRHHQTAAATPAQVRGKSSIAASTLMLASTSSAPLAIPVATNPTAR